MTDHQYSARDISDLLGLHTPTPEQEKVIEAPLEGVYRVIAGAGSGKTETMALRVLYLVANGAVAPHEVLGLTFTKKAAGELQTRLVERIQALGERLPGIAPLDPFDRPKVHTYNAFASRIFSDYAVYVGVDRDVHVSSQATAWGVARLVVKNSSDTRLASLDIGVDRVASLVVHLSQTLGENDVDEDVLSGFVDRFRALKDLPPGGRGAYAEVDGYVDAVSALEPLWGLVSEFQAAKRQRGIVEFSDQVRFALDVVRRAPHVVDALRMSHKVVLLDEYQDTSVLQSRLLSALYADHPVMAVGDPHQAIYGWRGASAGNLADFATQFAPGWRATTFSLATSWRNSTRVLDAANTLAAPLTLAQPDSVITLRPHPNAPEGAVEWRMTETLAEEAEALADWFEQRLGSAPDEAPTAALLMRNRSHQSVFVHALRERNIPVHVLGIGGLLSDPVVADVVCGVAVVHRPDANTELVRLLAGGRYRVGVADLYALAQVAKKLRKMQSSSGSDTDGEHRGPLIAPSLSLVEALDWLRTQPAGAPGWSPFSPEAKTRLRDAATLFHTRRRFAHDDLIDQLVGIEKALGIDIEVRSNPRRNDSVKARSALLDAAATFQATSDNPTVPGFIDWLQEAEWRDNLQPQTDEAEPGCVQVLTIHGAKGLEWDHVALARVVEDELPAAPRDGTRGWLKRGELPYPLRGDRDHLPHFSWEGQETRKDVKDAAAAFFAEVGDWRLSEERRLMYVGVTRAKKDVGLFGSWWATQKKPRRPSLFLRELADSGLVPALPDQPENDDNPAESREGDFLWPGDPLGERRDQVTDLADRVTGLMATMPDGIERADRDTVDDLIARAMTPPETLRPPIPVRLAASTLPGILADPAAVMQKRARPLPRRVRGNERAGTVFHEWVENHYRAAGNISLGGDWDPDETDTTPSEAQSDQWREAFLASEFAKKTPLAIEREIYLPVAGHTVVCKIDAVFATEKGVDIIDWKTGRPPATPEEETTRALQLSLYRMAWSAWSGTPLEAITVGWWFSTTGDVRRPRMVWEPDAIVSALNSALAGYWSRETKA